MLNAILTRWARTRGASSSSSSVGSSRLSTLSRSGNSADGRGTEQTAESIWHSLLRWMPGELEAGAGALPCQSVSLNDVPSARAAFEACLCGLHAADIEELQRSIRRSRSLRDLWHLRTWLYTEVAKAFSQSEAELRLNRLNAHFQFGASFGFGGQSARPLTQSRTGPH
jgi:hypothetical protein